MQINFLIVVFLIVIQFQSASARIFNLQKERFASYFILNAGTSNIQQNVFLNEANIDTIYSEELKTHYSGEFGFTYVPGPLALRFGFEFLRPLKLNNIEASNPSGNVLYSFSSDLMGYAPKIGIDLNFYTASQWRIFAFGTVGTATILIENDYTLTSLGKNAFVGVGDHIVNMTGSGSILSYGIGSELSFLDSTAALLELGYRTLKVNNLTYTKEITTFNGSHNPGDPVLTIDGDSRVLDFSGFFISLGFRFYMR